MTDIVIFKDPKLPKLNKGQEALCNLVCTKFNNGGIIKKNEIIDIWNTSVRKFKGQTYIILDNETGEEITKTAEYNDAWIDCYSTQWLVRSLGALIKK